MELAVGNDRLKLPLVSGGKTQLSSSACKIASFAQFSGGHPKRLAAGFGGGDVSGPLRGHPVRNRFDRSRRSQSCPRLA